MRDLEAYAAICMAEQRRLHIPFSENTEFRVNTRAKKRFGQCQKQGDRYFINISAFMLDERTGLNGLKSTIHHELLHTCPDCMNHGSRWKTYAALLNRTYGYCISTTNSPEEYRVPQELQLSAKYILRCKRCGQEYKRQKMTATVSHPEKYHCGRCGGDLIRVK